MLVKLFLINVLLAGVMLKSASSKAVTPTVFSRRIREYISVTAALKCTYILN